VQIEGSRLQKKQHAELQHPHHKINKVPNFIIKAQLGHKMNIKENLMILENIRILESFKIPKSQNIQHKKLETTNR
jgi:ABC-type transport system involved in cytochrome c biogenesis ATPase subunit